jgi:hypothetical protein
MKLFKNILPKESIEEIVKLLEINTKEWKDNHLVVPAPAAKRMIISIEKFPVIEEFYKKHFADLGLSLSSSDLPLEKLIYFASYKENSKCLPHTDPCKVTIIVSLKKPSEGGQLVIVDNEFDLEEGDAIMFNGYNKHSVKPVINGERLSLNIWLY